jgi:hypothetical protein
MLYLFIPVDNSIFPVDNPTLLWTSFRTKYVFSERLTQHLGHSADLSPYIAVSLDLVFFFIHLSTIHQQK